MGFKPPPGPPEWMVYKQRMTQLISDALKGYVNFESNPEETAQQLVRFAERLITEIDAATERNTER